MALTEMVEKQTKLYTVTELNMHTRDLLESHYGFVQICGEISNLSRPRSGHWYFTLKDAKCQVRCAMFKGANSKVAFPVEDGQEVIILAKVSIYPDRGDFQLIAYGMKISGEGQLRAKYEALKQKLAADGFFDKAHKKTIPTLPATIGVITSTTGAVLHDVMTALNRRYPVAKLCIYPCSVQGAKAKDEICRALKLANKHKECDVLILARGGGSLEDLWPFNEEVVAKAIYASHLPIICGVGHETDTTIADFVADLRAPTPTAAAELATPRKEDLMHQVINRLEQLFYAIDRLMETRQLRLSHIERGLIDPQQKVYQAQQQLGHLLNTLIYAIDNQWQGARQSLKAHFYQLQQQDPSRLIQAHHYRLKSALQQTTYHLGNLKQQQNHRLASLLARLHDLSPLNTLARGYTITLDSRTGKMLAKAELNVGDTIETRTLKKTYQSTITEIK